MEKVNETVTAVLGSKKVAMPRAGGGTAGHKILFFGPINSGKTFALADLIHHCGERLLVVSTEQGGNGLVTVRNELAKRGVPELYEKGIFSIDPVNYEQTRVAFSKVKGVDGKYYPALYDHYPELREFKPTTLVWEGLSNFQSSHVFNHLLGDSSDIEDVYPDPRKFWGEVGRIMRLAHYDFQTLSDPDYDWNHILTVHDKEEWAKDEKGNRAKGATKPLSITFNLAGSAGNDIGSAYDLVIRTRKDEKTNMANPMGAPIITHMYQVSAGSEKATVKNRGFNLPDEFPADMVRVWKEVKKGELK